MRCFKRLEAIASCIDAPEKVVADIGCDHGYLGKMLIDSNRAKKVIATDISAPSLEKTANLAQKYEISDKLLTKLGFGLNPIKNGEAQIIVIAGMGGREIIKILEHNTDNKIEMFVLQPAQDVLLLRKFLNENNYHIVKDFITLDKKNFYNTIVATFGDKKQKLSSAEMEFGLTNFDLKSEDFYQYLLNYKNKCRMIIDKSQSEEYKEKLSTVDTVINKLYNL